MEGSRENARRYARLAVSMAVTLALVGCGGLGLLPYQTDIQTTHFQSYQAVETAYQEITPGQTQGLRPQPDRLRFRPLARMWKSCPISA